MHRASLRALTTNSFVELRNAGISRRAASDHRRRFRKVTSPNQRLEPVCAQRARRSIGADCPAVAARRRVILCHEGFGANREMPNSRYPHCRGRAIPRGLKIAILLRQGSCCADCSARLVMGSFVFDHRPPLTLREVSDDANDPERLAAICSKFDDWKIPRDLRDIAQARGYGLIRPPFSPTTPTSLRPGSSAASRQNGSLPSSSFVDGLLAVSGRTASVGKRLLRLSAHAGGRQPPHGSAVKAAGHQVPVHRSMLAWQTGAPGVAAHRTGGAPPASVTRQSLGSW
jgi:hypothetical protein